MFRSLMVLCLALAVWPAAQAQELPSSVTSSPAWQGCEQGDGMQCGALGVVLMTGAMSEEGIPKNFDAAGPLLKKGCDMQSYDACETYGIWLLDESNPAPNEEVARQVSETACTRGHSASACSKAGLLVGNADYAAASSYFRQSCEGAYAGGCTMLGYYSMMGRGGPKDLAAAAVHFQRGCDLEDATSCTEIGLAYLKGDGIAKDRKKAKAYLKKACGLGNKDAC